MTTELRAINGNKSPETMTEVPSSGQIMCLFVVSNRPGVMMPICKPNRNGVLQPAGSKELLPGLRVRLSNAHNRDHRKPGRRTTILSVYALVDERETTFVTSQDVYTLKGNGLELLFI